MRNSKTIKAATYDSAGGQSDESSSAIQAILEKSRNAALEFSTRARRMERPFVTLSFAQSLNGSIAARPGEQLILSGADSMIMTHGLRAAHDAILVGIGTILIDNPQLTVRLVEGHSPQPIVIDSRLRFPLNAKLLMNGNKPPWIATSGTAHKTKAESLRRRGARLITLPTGVNGRIKIGPLLKRIRRLGVRSVMVEGGARIISSFLEAGMVDQMVITIAPVFVDGLNAFETYENFKPSAPRLNNIEYHKAGADLILRGDIERP